MQHHLHEHLRNSGKENVKQINRECGGRDAHFYSLKNTITGLGVGGYKHHHTNIQKAVAVARWGERF